MLYAIGNEFTVSVFVTWQPVLVSVYNISTVLPNDAALHIGSGVTTPAASTDATFRLLLAHVPPAVALLIVTALGKHVLAGPVVADGFGLTVAVIVVWQPVGNV